MQRNALLRLVRTVWPLALFAAISVAGLGGCAGGAGRPPSARIVIDGDISEWPTDVVATADEHYLYLRFKVAGPPMTLQSAPETLSILLDADDNRGTGSPIAELAAASSMGVDLEIQFSPMTDAGVPANGVSAIAIDSTGATERLSHAALDFHFAPTFAADWYEARLARQSTGSGLLSPGILQGRSLRGIMGLYDSAGNIAGVSEPFATSMPPAAGSPARSSALIPSPPRGAIRVVSYNILRSSPSANPGPFTRLLRALNPDVVLIQEWDTDAQTIQSWFDTAMPEHAPWTVVATTGLYGVGIVSRYPVVASSAEAGQAERLGREVTLPDGQSVRFVAAAISTPRGELLIGSAHLKCCGTSGSSEDLRRLEEAAAINGAFDAMAARGPSMRVIGGDTNLVGSRGPIDALRSRLDADGSDLELAPAMVLGDAAYYTWSDAGSPFSPGRLDYVLVGDSQARVARSFVLDTQRLSDAALAQAGLERGDSRASDHMPVVVDLIRR